MLIIGVNGIIAMLLPYAVESYPVRVRGRAAGWVAACTTTGGRAAQFLSPLGLVSALAAAALPILVPVVLAFGLVRMFCVGTRDRDLCDLEAAPTV